MDKVLLTIIWVISIILVLYAAYYVFLAIFGLKRTKRITEPHAPKHKFLIMIAARNEGIVIGYLIDSLLKQNYPRELFEILVVVNNTTDDTEAVALRHGARALVCPLRVRSKGDAMAWAYQNLPPDIEFDAVCIFDADNLAHPDFLLQMNQALCSGIEAAQGYRDTKNPHDTWNSGTWAINYWLGGRFYNQPHHVLSLSSIIYGTGFMLSHRIIEKIGGLQSCTLAEDFEITMQCILADEKVGWVPDAITYDEQSLGFDTTWKQRRRWLVGFLQVISLYGQRLIKATLHKPTRVKLDFMLYMLTPFATYLSIIVFSLGVVLRLVVLKYPLFPLTQFYDMFGPSLIMSILFPIALALFVVIVEKKFKPGIIKGILGFPLFMMLAIPLHIVALLIYKKDFRWEEIRHTKAVSIDQIERNE
ncbi:MAG: glycosyltransferase family 2 protein [Saccharofermentanales bacterium]|jgi:cellulose synthase/poly-beta-1,6-N-acetylglucosamine synthase-like glycosyltransferase